MAVLKLVGANRYMNKNASPLVILKGGLTDDIKDEGLVNSLLNAKRIDSLNNAHPMFELVSATVKVPEPKVPEPEVEEVVEEEVAAPKPKATRKKSTRARKPANT